MALFHAETVEPILSSSVHIGKSSEYDSIRPWLGDGLLLSTGDKWRSRRKLLTPAFHFKILEDAVPVFNANADILTEILTSESEVDISPFITRCTLDILLETAMGKSLQVQHQRQSEYAKCIGQMLHLVQVRQKSPWLYPDFLFNLFGWGGKQKQYLDVMHGFTKRVIKERKAEFTERIQNGDFEDKGRKKAFLDLLLKLQYESGDSLSDLDLQEEVDTFMFEGHDTTASAITWAILLLGKLFQFFIDMFENFNL